MSFLENIGKAAQAAAKKSSELVEITKLNMNINSEEDKIQKQYTQIGKLIYDKFKAGGNIDEEFLASCETIRTHEQNINNLKEKILETKNLRVCSGCGAEIDKNSMFCAKCGTKQDVQQAAGQQAVSAATCPACGAQITAGSAFCTGCGAKMD